MKNSWFYVLQDILKLINLDIKKSLQNLMRLIFIYVFSFTLQNCDMIQFLKSERISQFFKIFVLKT